MRPYRIALVFTLPILFSCTLACIHHAVLAGEGSSTGAEDPGAIEDTAALFAHDPAGAPPPQIQEQSDREGYTVSRVHFPDRPGALFPGDGVDAYEYRPREEAGLPGPGVILLPIQGAEYEVSTYFAEYFVSRGIPCLRFERRAEWLEADRDFETLALLIREYVVDVRRGLRWWLESGRVAPDSVGIFGVSMGAIIGSMTAALEAPSVHASVLVIGGGSFADILMTADDEEINRWRDQCLRRSGGDEANLAQALHEALDPVDPLRLASRIDPATTLMIHARFDHVVRYPLTTRIWEAAGRPERIVIPTGHYSSVYLIHSIRR